MKINLFILLLAALSIPFSDSRAEGTKDPFAEIKTMRLSNGLTAVVAPSPNAEMVEIRMSVNAGFRDEKWGKSGTAHLLEHYLFWDPNLDPGLTYLDLIKEKGGKGNAVTSLKHTTYYATVERRHANWIMEIFSKILLNKTFREDAVELAKKPVYLEIGEPSFFDYISPSRIPLYQKLTHLPSVWEREFGIEDEHGLIMRSSDKIDTRNLTADDLKTFYWNYYRPENITILMSGGINGPEVLARIEDLFGSEPARTGPIHPPIQPQAKVRPFRQVSTTSVISPRIEVGTKVANISPQEKMVADVYLKHLSHRLMKELRNKKGETYTVYPSAHTHERHGLISVHFETSRERYSANLSQIREMIHRETQLGEISQADFDEAIRFFEREYKLNDKDAASMLSLAQTLVAFRKEFPEESERSPFAVYSDITFETYKDRLKHLFRPEMAYESRTEPPLFFRFDSILFSIIGFAFWMYLSKVIFAKTFHHNQVRWVRKLRYFPAYMVQLGSLAFSLIFSAIGIVFVYKVWMSAGLVQFHSIISDYLPFQLSIGIVILGFQLVMMTIARKAMVVKDEIWVKSLGYWSYRYPLSSVESVTLIHPLRLLCSPVLMFRTGLRFFYYFDLRFWQKGLLIQFKNKKCLFLALTDPKDAKAELEGFLHTCARTAQIEELKKAA